MNNMNYWKLLGSTAVLMTALCVGVFLYARWDVQRFAESLGELPTSTPQKTQSTQNHNEQTTFGKPVTFKTDEELGLVKQQETESQITDIDGEEASLDADPGSFDGLGDESLDARLENRDLTDTAGDALADFLQEQLANSRGKDSNGIVIEGLDATQASDWIEIDGQTVETIEIEGYTINLEDLGDTPIIIEVIE